MREKGCEEIFEFFSQRRIVFEGQGFDDLRRREALLHMVQVVWNATSDKVDFQHLSAAEIDVILLQV